MTTFEYGDWKSIEDIGFADLSSHPIWVWCSLLPGEEDGPMGGDECSMRPLLSTDNVTAAHPSAIILLRVKDTDYYASGCYDLRSRQITALAVYNDGEFVRCADQLVGMPPSPVDVSVPKLDGVENVEFTTADQPFDTAVAVE